MRPASSRTKPMRPKRRGGSNASDEPRSAQARVLGALLTLASLDAGSDARWEPVAQASRIAARVLLAGQADDHVLPVRDQMAAFAAVHPATETLVTAPGAIPYMHGSFSAASRAGFSARMRAFLRRG